MDIQATISKLQSDIKYIANEIYRHEKECIAWKISAKHKSEHEDASDYIDWRYYHEYKDEIAILVKQQKINKSLYKIMCKIQKQMPNGSISMNEIREI